MFFFLFLTAVNVLYYMDLLFSFMLFINKHCLYWYKLFYSQKLVIILIGYFKLQVHLRFNKKKLHVEKVKNTLMALKLLYLLFS